MLQELVTLSYSGVLVDYLNRPEYFSGAPEENGTGGVKLCKIA